MSYVSERTRELIFALKELGTVAQRSATDVYNVEQFLKRIGSGTFTGGMDELSAGIRGVAAAFKSLGASSADIQRIEQELLRFAQIRDRFGRGAVKSDVENPLNLLQMEARIIAQGGRQLQDIPKSEHGEVYRKYIQILKELEAQAIKTGNTMKQQVRPGIWLADDGQQQKVRANEQWLKQLDLAPRGVENLRKRLQTLGIVNAEVASNTTELSNGITRMRFVTGDATRGFKTYTVTMDKAGNILNDTQKRFRTFGDAIVRDTVEVLKWTLAIGLIYGPIRKLNELIDQSRQIQESLIDVQITLGQSTANLTGIFQEAAAIANETSSSIEGVLGGFSEALAATGSIENPAQRIAQANALLRDSMVLSKLAGIDQAEALDTLVGALRQTGGELYDSQRLLDSWVATSKNANVSLNQLASTFAIVGSAAEEVGISSDELNAIVGTLAEATKLSADETGNAIRGFISGFQSAKAESTLAKFGIAVRTTSGEVRSFTDLLNELAVLQQEGILSERNVAEITNVIGGGFRRGAQLSALMSNYNRVLQLTEVSQNASGDAAEALELKMSTLESAITRLSNSFANLAQAMGGEGGALGGLTTLVDGVTALTDALSSLVRVMGTAAPILATLGLLGAVGKTGTAATYLGKNIPASLAYLFAPTLLQQGPQYTAPEGLGLGGGGLAPLQQAGPTSFSTVSWGTFLGNISNRIGTAVANALSKIPGVGGALSNLGLGGLIVPGVLAGTQIASGQYEKAGFTLGGSFLTAVASGGNPIVTALGSIMASAFYDTFIKFDEDIAARWGQTFVENIRNAQAGGTGLQAETLDETFARLEKNITENLTLYERFTLGNRAFYANLQGYNLQELVQQIGGVAEERAQILPEGRMTSADILTALSLLQETGAPRARFTPYAGPEAEYYDIFGGLKGAEGGGTLREGLNEPIQELLKTFFRKQLQEGIILTPTQEKIGAETDKMAVLAASVAEDMVQAAIDEISEGGKEGVSNYLRASGIQNQLALSAANLIVAIQEANQEVGAGLPVPTREEAVRLVSETTPEQAELLAKTTGEIVNGLEEMRRLSEQPFLSPEETKRFQELEIQVNGATLALGKLIPAIQDAIALTKFEKEPLEVIDIPDNLTPEQIDNIVKMAENYRRYVLEAMGYTMDEIQAWFEARSSALLRSGLEIVPQQTKATADDIGRITEGLGYGAQGNQLQILDLRNRLGAGQFQQFLTRYAQIVSAFKQNIPGFELDQSQVAVILKEGLRTLDLDMRLANLALQDLVELQRESMVEGMFNLPTGGTFFVPFEPAALDARSRVGGGGSAFDPNSFFAQFEPDPNALEAAAHDGTKEGILDGLDLLREGKPYGPPAPPPEPKDRGYAHALAYKLKHLTPRTPEEAYYPTREPGGFPEPKAIERFDEDTLLGSTANTFFSGLLTAISELADIPNDFLKLFELITGQNLGGGDDTLEKSYKRGGPTELQKGDISTKLSLDVNTNVQLMLDGRVIAEVVKPYLYEDLIRYEGSAGTGSLSVTV